MRFTTQKIGETMMIGKANRGILSMWGILLSPLVLTFLAGTAKAQPIQYYVDETYGFPNIVSKSWTVDVGDVDGDGKPDILFGNNGEQTRIYINLGGGNFGDETSGRLPLVTYSTTSVKLLDVDGDNDLDIVMGNRSGQQSRIYINDGTGHFTDETASRLPAGAYDTIRVAVGDVTGDGSPDIYLANYNGGTGQQNVLWINDGTGHFSDQTSSRLPVIIDSSNGALLVDVNGDSSKDIVVTNVGGQQNRLYLNNGTGNFTDVTSTNMPTNTGNHSTNVAAADVDSDGDIDLIIGNGGSQAAQLNRLYLNDGTGTFTDSTTGHMPSVSDSTVDVDIIDANGDGCPDVVDANYNSRNRLFLNGKSGTTCTGVFTDGTVAASLPADSVYTRESAIADFDGDGDADIVFANVSAQSQLLINNGAGVFSTQSSQLSGRIPADTDNSTHAVMFDADRDGDIDIVIGARNQQTKIYINDGTGHFTNQTSTRLPIASYDTIRIAVGDVNGDGYADRCRQCQWRSQSGLPQRRYGPLYPYEWRFTRQYRELQRGIGCY
jgi:hypothetical protein